MTAREELLRNLRGYEPREDTADDPAAQMLDAYRAEVLREAAEKIRRWADANQKHLLEGERSGARMAAQHISPYNIP